MNRFLLTFALLTAMTSSLPAQENHKVDLTFIETTDVHGNFFPYNFITRTPWQGSMARVATYVDSVRGELGKERVVLLDNGDILQGQPTAYYFNFIDTITPNIASRIYDYLDYDAVTIGNHDVETGHAVYDRWISQTRVPVMGANVIDTATGQPYLKPYTIIERNGVRIAVLGLLTPAIPAWLPEPIWAGLEFDDMDVAAKKWIPIIREKENPDLIVGLFHSGHDASRRTGRWVENASTVVAEDVPGFDLVFIGHDHQRYNTRVGAAGVPVLNPANNAMAVARADVSLTFDADGNLVDKTIEPSIVEIATIEPSAAYLAHFESDRKAVDEFVDRIIGTAEGEFTSRDAYFGPSAFIDLIHRLQLEITGADISFAAPLSADATIAKGPVRVSDMFNLYKYENLLYTMEMTGEEIARYLERAYDVRLNHDPVANGHLLLFESENPTPDNNRLQNPAYNFDSAAGINYVVDITKPRGERVEILSMADGTPFDRRRTYRVAVNSYRGNGGGDHMTKGAGIDASELKNRIVNSTDLDLRYYMMKRIEDDGTLRPTVTGNWRFIPEAVAAPLIETDRLLLFSPESSRNQK